jgi:hypothetical protein
MADDAVGELVAKALADAGVGDAGAMGDLDEGNWPTLAVPRLDRDDLPMPARYYRALAFRASQILGGCCFIEWDDSPSFAS